MATRKRNTRKVVAQGSGYIDPLHCDSTISYKVIDKGRWVWGDVQLSDCNRKIDWYFGNTNPVQKIDKAIALLTEFREAFVNAEAARRKRARTASRKAAVKK